VEMAARAGHQRAARPIHVCHVIYPFYVSRTG